MLGQLDKSCRVNIGDLSLREQCHLLWLLCIYELIFILFCRFLAFPKIILLLFHITDHGKQSNRNVPNPNQSICQETFCTSGLLYYWHTLRNKFGVLRRQLSLWLPACRSPGKCGKQRRVTRRDASLKSVTPVSMEPFDLVEFFSPQDFQAKGCGLTPYNLL